MTPADRAAIVERVYAEEIRETGLEDVCYCEACAYERLLGSVPRHDAPIEIQRAFAGPELPHSETDTWR